MSSKSTEVVVDSYGWVEYFIGGSEKAAEVIEKNEIHTSLFSLVEIASRLERARYGRVDEAITLITQLSRVWSFDEASAIKIGKLHATLRRRILDFGVGDCFVLELAERLGAKILTGDKHFKGFKNVIFLD